MSETFCQCSPPFYGSGVRLNLRYGCLAFTGRDPSSSEFLPLVVPNHPTSFWRPNLQALSSMRPKLSIIVPVYDRADQVRLLIDRFGKLIRSTHAEDLVELIVVDDGSPEALDNLDHRVCKLLRNASRSGAPAARKLGFQHSTGTYIHFHDSDDDVSDNWLKVVLEHIEAGKFDFLFTPRRLRTNPNMPDRQLEPVVLRRLLNRPTALRNYLSYENCIGPLGSVTFSRTAVDRMSFPSIESCQDWHMYWEGLSGNSLLIYERDIWFIYNQSGENRISASSKRKRLGLIAASELMCQSQRKLALVQKFLLLGLELKTCSQKWSMRLAFYKALRLVLLQFALNPALDKWFFGTPHHAQ